ncbi:MAG: alanine dehydrogenase [Candidatus Cloacimonetes bacterium]|nr:alanine dehydrogenase [Candidatus Cloacimonadota bacterium]
MRTIGFLSMRFEVNEKRDFRPAFFQRLANLDNEFLLEESYGAKLGFHEDGYRKANKRIKFCSRDAVFVSDCVITVRTPDFGQLEKLKPGALLFSMLHYLTHDRRNKFLADRKIQMYSMDSVIDDFGIRMIHDFPGSVENAFQAAKSLLIWEKIMEPLRVLILGSGEMGKLAADTAVKFTDRSVVVSVVGRSVTRTPGLLNPLLKESDILVDASKRHETHKSIVSNHQLELLPENALIIDLSADDYDVNISPIQVKGIEGIPTGNLDKYLFYTDDEAYKKIPPGVDSSNRRVLLSCNAWPGVDPMRCLNKYETQLDPFIRLLAKDTQEYTEESDNPYERALARASYSSFKRL